MKLDELRKLYIDFFKKRNHKEIYTSSLIPDNDPSVLFTTAGMHPLVPFLLGEKHPSGKRLVNFQKCLRTGDIDEVGDTTHLTFFEMMGNWSLGDYFKRESITLSNEFLTEVLKIPQEKIYVTVFSGDETAPCDAESAEIWKELGYKDSQIFYYGKKENWWGPAGLTGPCGPDTEIFIDIGREKCSNNCQPSCNCGKYVEIWNNVFMEYNKDKDGKYIKLSSHNVDTGLGLERVLAVMNNVSSVYDTEVFIPIIRKIEELTGTKYDEDTTQQFRIISDHLRATTFILGDDKSVTPSNVDQGYVVRRLIRRAYRYLKQIGSPENTMSRIADVIIEEYSGVYPELLRNREFILKHIAEEEKKFSQTLEKGLKIAQKNMCRTDGMRVLESEIAFNLYSTYGFPLELIQELAKENDVIVDTDEFKKMYIAHQEKSRIGASQKFKGGLVDSNDETIKLHTATHLLHAALRRILNVTIYQRGSNINPTRLRFDFSFDRKLTTNELIKIENFVNEAIGAEYDVICEEMDIEKAKEEEATGAFDNKYDDNVKVYTIGNISKEICGGPHVQNTRELGFFKINREESSSAGVRRIKASLSANQNITDGKIKKLI